MSFNDYQTEGFYDELFESPGTPRGCAAPLVNRINSLSYDDLLRRQQSAESSLMNMGITFTVYGQEAGTERIFPFDIIPRVVPAADWQPISAGLAQRITALNLFIDDLYHDQKIINDGVIPADMIHSAVTFRPECVGLNPPRGIWIHITGSDLVRDTDGAFYVLEDNLRCPSGVSYVLENRELLKRTYPDIFQRMHVRPVYDYPHRLLETLSRLAPDHVSKPTVVVLTPGPYNSAYFEHAYLAQQMGVELVENRDLVVIDDYVMMRTTSGFQRVDVIYRRIDDDFIDPLVFRPDSMLGVPGIMQCYRKGNVALANAPGTGIADDKAVYAYVPRIIKYYLDEDPIIHNVPTFICAEKKDRDHVLANLDKLVVKAVDLSGGYGMLIGPHSTQQERDEFAAAIQAEPRKYIAQPTLSLSRAPCIVDGTFEGRHVDLRPFALYGEKVDVVPGGLTRVALRKGSLVVNSSQGGGSKDTWVLADDNPDATLPVTEVAHA
ncbi:circularly permuted type 2 ATP-grasp protein [Planctomycetales bacterium ZRK34]|nr:circularly permuted type 2 ATP-grasp protein [Planctomycetales bacterium ZRK34]